MNKTKRSLGFTLVEIIVVVVIMAILSMIGFVSYNSYFVNSRDATRISNMVRSVNAFQSYALEAQLPLPEDAITISLSGSIVGYQGKLSEDVLETVGLPRDFMDPKDKTYYSYFLGRNKKSFQFLVFMEQDGDGQSLVSTSYAQDYVGRYPRTFGDSLGIFTKTDTNTPLEDLSLTGSTLSLDNMGLDYELSSHLSSEQYVTGKDTRFSILPEIVNSKGKGWVIEDNSFKCYDPNSDGRCSKAQDYITYNKPTLATMKLKDRGGIRAKGADLNAEPVIENPGGDGFIGFEVTMNTRPTTNYTWVGEGTEEDYWNNMENTNSAGGEFDYDEYMSNYQITSANQIRLPLHYTGEYNFTVDWESDGIMDDTITSYNQLEASHVYEQPGIYTINIVGTLKGLYFPTSGANTVLEVSNWGGVQFADVGSVFSGTSNLKITAEDTPDTSNLTNMSRFFANTGLTNEDLSDWDTSNVTNMSYIFYGANTKFNGDVTGWDTSNVTDMSYAFYSNKTSNFDISSWDTSSVTNMKMMFSYNEGFNNNINTNLVSNASGSYIAWDTSNVTDMEGMFYENKAFNSPIGNWDITSLRNTYGMFQSSLLFNQEVNTKQVTLGSETYIAWDVKDITNIRQIFCRAQAFNGDVSNWNIIRSPTFIFYSAKAFNNDVSTKEVNLGGYTYTAWNTSLWTSAGGIFNGAGAFNQPLNSWDVSNMTNLGGIISKAYDLPLDNWDTSKNKSLRYVFASGKFNQDISMWDTSSLEDLENAFWRNDAFNQDISTKTITRPDGSTYTAWDVSKVTDMKSAFDDADAFNQDISNWDVSSVKTMESAFNNAASFDQDIFAKWDTLNVTNMSRMFGGKFSNKSDVENLDTSSVTNLKEIFVNNNPFNQDVSTKVVTRGDGSTYTAWDVSNVTNMNSTFRRAKDFNYDISNWDTSSVTDMAIMFDDAQDFDQDISSWDVSAITACNEFDSQTSENWVEAEKPNFALSCTKGI